MATTGTRRARPNRRRSTKPIVPTTRTSPSKWTTLTSGYRNHESRMATPSGDASSPEASAKYQPGSSSTGSACTVTRFHLRRPGGPRLSRSVRNERKGRKYFELANDEDRQAGIHQQGCSRKTEGGADDAPEWRESESEQNSQCCARHLYPGR